MSIDRDRDPIDDRLLKAGLTPNEPGVADACLDAETLAAWADGSTTLTKRGSTAQTAEDIEQHLATCARCQALLAAFAASDLEAATVVQAAPIVVPFRPRRLARWVPLVVATAAAASLVIWTAWPKGPTESHVEEKMADATPQLPSPLSKEKAAPAATATPTATTAEARANRKAQNTTPPAPQHAQPSPVPMVTPAPVVAPLPAPPPPPIAGATGAASAAAALPAPPAVTGATRAAGAAAPRPEIVALRASADATTKEAATRVVAEFGSPSAPVPNVAQGLVGSRAAGGGGGGRGGAGGMGGLLSVNRNLARVSWRVFASGQVERSNNGGDTWTPVTISPAAVITSGSAPSPSVCWLVGRTGIVLLSTDGVTFKRVSPPDPTDLRDLRSIIAIDDHQATVTTTDGKV